MNTAPVPLNEDERLRALASYRILDSSAEADFDDLARLAADLCSTPVALISFVDATRQWFKARVGFAAAETPRATSFCAHTLTEPDLLVVPDALEDPRFAGNPLVTGGDGMRFYAGTPLRTSEGYVLGALCVFDRLPRELSAREMNGLRALGRQVVAQLELRRRLGELEASRSTLHQTETQLHASDRRLAEIITGMSEACFALDQDWRFTFINGRCESLLRHAREEMLGRSIWEVFSKLVGTPMEQNYRRAMQERIPVVFETHSPIAERWLEIRLFPSGDGLAAFLLDVEERKTLERERHKFFSLAENSQEFIGVCDLEGIPHYINPAGRGMVGGSAWQDLRKLSVLDFFFPEDRAWIREEFLPRVRREGHAEVEIRFRHFQTSEPIWMLYHVFTIADGGGEPVGFATVSRNITERKETEEALRIKQAHAEALLRLAQRLERATTFAEVLAEARGAVEQALGLRIAWFYLLSADGESLQLIVSDDARGKGPAAVGGEVLKIAGDGMLEEIVKAEHLVVIQDAQTDPRVNPEIVRQLGSRTILNMPILLAGKRLGAIGTGTFGDEGIRNFSAAERDFFAALASQVAAVLDRVIAMQDRQRAEEAVRKSEERLQTVIENLSEGLVIARLDGQLIHWNPAALRMHGFQKDEDWCRGLESFASTFELATLEGARLSFEEWPMPRLFRGEKLQDMVVRLARIGTDWKRVFRYNGAIVQEPHGERVAFLTITDITERRQAEEKLHASLKDNFDLRAALDEHAIVATTDPQGRITYVNDKFCAISKYNREELLGQDHRLINSKFHDKEFMRRLWSTIRRGKVWHGEIKNRAKDGSAYWVDTTIVPFLNDAQQIRQYVAIRADITERKRAEQALEENRRFLSDVIEYSGSLVFVKDRDGRYQLVNRKWEEVTGVLRAETLGRTDREIFAQSDDAEQYRNVDLAVIASGESQVLEETLTQAGQTRSFLSVKFPLRDASGAVIGICGMATEITDRKEAEEKMREQAALLDTAQDAILVRDLRHRVTYWNKGAERLYEWTAEEAIGQSIAELLYRDPSAFIEATKLVVERGEWVGEIEQITKSRRPVVVGCRWTLVRNEEGRPKAILAINTDLTERKKLEQQFLRAQRMESIGTLAGGIAHDLNNVLGPIMMSLELLKMRFPDRDSQELISIISTSAERGADMVRQVLSFARGVAGRRLEVQVRHLVRDVEKIVNDTFLKHVQVRTDLPKDLWTVLGDATQLHQVLLNLCVNARDAMPQGGMLTISAANLMLDAQYAGLNMEATPGPYVVLEVEDSGTGIPPDILEKIFDPFFTTKEVGKGTGLGLATTLAIVKSHAGFIRLYSELGKGTRFKVYIPASTEESGEPAAPPSGELPRGQGECVLVVDDEASVRQITQQTLEAFGYRVIVACDGAEALSLFAVRQVEIAIVLTDMMMPVMDGPALIRVLQKMKRGLPIIAASGLAANEHVARAASLGVKHFLPKPYTAETLLNVLHQVLRP